MHATRLMLNICPYPCLEENQKLLKLKCENYYLHVLHDSILQLVFKKIFRFISQWCCSLSFFFTVLWMTLGTFQQVYLEISYAGAPVGIRSHRAWPIQEPFCMLGHTQLHLDVP